MRLDLRKFELQNLIRTPDGLRVRKAVVQLVTPTSGCAFVGGFTIESPNTTEPLHFLFEQNTTSGTVTLRVYTEEYFEISNYAVGIMQRDPVFTCAVSYGQYMINSPSLSTPLYGLVGGGGPIAAVKTASINPDTTAGDIPSGHICTFGDRFAIAAGNLVFFNDPPTSASLDPRTFVLGSNNLTLPGTVYDLFQGQDGALYIFTSAGVYSVPADALSNAQAVQGFLSRVPGLDTSRSRNACACAGSGVVLQRDRVVLLGDTANPIDLAPYNGRRLSSTVVAVDDLRLSGELFATPTGFIVGFRGKRGFYADVDINSRTFSYILTGGSGFNVVGTLRSRDGEALVICSDGVFQQFVTGPEDGHNAFNVHGTASGKIPVGGARSTLRRVSVSADLTPGTGASTVYVSGSTKVHSGKVLTGEATLGTSLWGATTSLASRQDRAFRHNFAVKASDPHIEIDIAAAGRHVDPFFDVEFDGTRDGEDVN